MASLLFQECGWMRAGKPALRSGWPCRCPALSQDGAGSEGSSGAIPHRLSERGSPVFKSSFAMKNHSSRPNSYRTTSVIYIFFNKLISNHHGHKKGPLHKGLTCNPPLRWCAKPMLTSLHPSHQSWGPAAPSAPALGTAMGTSGHEPSSPLRQHWPIGSAGGIEGWKEITARSPAGTLNVSGSWEVVESWWGDKGEGYECQLEKLLKKTQ